MPTLSGAVSRIFLFLKAVRYGRHEEILPEFLLTVKNLSFAPGGPDTASRSRPGRSHARSSASWSPWASLPAGEAWGGSQASGCAGVEESLADIYL